MKSLEAFVAPESEYFVYAPSKTAQETFLYPTQCGLFSYLPGYSLTRESFDSFLLMYIRKGELTLTFENAARRVNAGNFVFLDCYKRHAYSTQTGWECLWCHFDGITARPYYNSVVSRLGNAFSLPDPQPVLRRLTSILQVFSKGEPVREALFAKYLTDILTEFLLCTPVRENPRCDTGMAEETITYINEHFREEIPVDALAARAGLSKYHFIRTFKRETGFTPHEYLIRTRMATARYLLKNTRLSVKDICFACGYSSESVFCTAFRRNQGMTPEGYRALRRAAERPGHPGTARCRPRKLEFPQTAKTRGDLTA